MEAVFRFLRRYPLAITTLLVLALTVALWGTGSPAARWVATGYVAIIIVLTVVDMVKQVLRGSFGLDILAVVAMIAALAVGEYMAAIIVALMLTGGEALEDYASGRAERELAALVSRAPQTAERLLETGGTKQIHVDQVHEGDLLLVKPSRVVPVDAELVTGSTSVDESSLTGESMPVSKSPGDALMSGSVNGNQAITVRAVATASNSQYQRIVQLVRDTEAAQAPTIRVADRYALPFTVISLIVAGLAWYFSGSPTRFAEVLVLATPCPLLIAAPVAFLGGMSRASRLGIIVKGGATLEALAHVRSAAFDKTGTLTAGRPAVDQILSEPGLTEQQLLQLTAAAEQFSSHVLAAGILADASERGIDLLPAENASETATFGVEATVNGEQVRVGKKIFIEEAAGPVTAPALAAGQTAVYVARGNQFAGSIILADSVRPEAPATLQALQHLGVTEIALMTGDAQTTAESVGSSLGIDHVHAGLLPEDKVRLVSQLPQPSLMVGDGINDAPVLAAASVGIAMGARGASAASESADAVITREDLSLVARAVDVGRWTYAVAITAILIGIALSFVFMGFAAFGHIPATVGALMQELVDLACILYALRALKGPDRVLSR